MLFESDDSPTDDPIYIACRDHGGKRPGREMLEAAWHNHRHLIPDPAHFAGEFRRHFYARCWELYIIDLLVRSGLSLIRPPRTNAPDVLVHLSDGRRCWVECVVPLPGMEPGIPSWATPDGPLEFRDHQEAPVLRRYASSLRCKFERFAKYLASGAQVRANDLTIVAVNQGALPWSEVHDAAVPAIAKALFGLGEDQLIIPTELGEPARFVIAHREAVPKNATATVPSRMFLDPGGEHISAVAFAQRAVWEYAYHAPGSSPLCVIHNPTAANEAPRDVLPAKGMMWGHNGHLHRTGQCSMSDSKAAGSTALSGHTDPA